MDITLRCWQNYYLYQHIGGIVLHLKIILSSVLSLKYRTYMNTIVAIIPDLCISFLQKQNIKHNIQQLVKTNE